MNNYTENYNCLLYALQDELLASPIIKDKMRSIFFNLKNNPYAIKALMEEIVNDIESEIICYQHYANCYNVYESDGSIEDSEVINLKYTVMSWNKSNNNNNNGLTESQ